ncbi:MAG: efflux RND transporter periplasmic adaptor subunit [Aggregatilineales bacterium]
MRMRNLIRNIVITLCAVGLSACSAVQTTLSNPSGAQPAAAQGVPTSTAIPTAPAIAKPTVLVQRGDVENILDVSGRWEPRDQLTLSFPIAGQVRNVNVQTGSTVSKNATLADLQITNLENQLASAQVALNAAIANLNATNGILQNVQNAEVSLANAQVSLKQTQLNNPWTQVQTAENNLKSAQTGVDNAQRSLDDAIANDSPAGTVDSARQALASAQTNLANAQANYYSAAQNYASHLYDVQKAQNAVAQAQIGLQSAQVNTQVDPTKLQAVESDQLNVQNLQQQIDQSTIKAPIDGLILDVTIKPGDQVTAFTAVITIGKPTPLEVVANIAYSDASSLSIGLVGIAQPLNHPEQAVQAIVRHVPLSAKDADQTTRVAAILNVPEGSLVELLLPKQISHNVLWLPPSFVRTFQTRNFVVLQTANGPRSVDVTLGLTTTDRDEITSGLNEGDIVIGP